eukprot:TRINITY_DN5310_c0_g1_i1.p1 TRINITY_DN5310_c0_g1~~TRINITY_DN5310_c0_g1_i1.p1  ORF type:complete len:472 (+),score=95.93 TRINITY_DN5310_c0_g1_i1:300-1715(+)
MLVFLLPPHHFWKIAQMKVGSSGINAEYGRIMRPNRPSVAVPTKKDSIKPPPLPCRPSPRGEGSFPGFERRPMVGQEIPSSFDSERTNLIASSPVVSRPSIPPPPPPPILMVADKKSHESTKTQIPTFLVEIVCAHDLKASDSDGKSDPYVRLFFFGMRRESRMKSEVVMNNLDPVWHQKFRVTIPTPSWEACPDFILWVMDYDIIEPDFLGEVRIPASEIRSMSYEWTEKMVYPLTPPSFGQFSKNDEVVKGTLTLKFSVQDGYKRAYFGKTLNYSHKAAKNRGQEHLIPAVIKRLDNPVDLKMEGITRIPGSKLQVDSLARSLDRGQPIDWSSVDPFTCTSLLKHYLSSLPQPLFPNSVFESTLPICLEEPNAVEKIRDLLRSIPEPGAQFLKSIFKYFVHIVNNQNDNKMSPHAISISIGSSLCINNQLNNDSTKFLSILDHVIQLITFITCNFGPLWEDDVDECIPT